MKTFDLHTCMLTSYYVITNQVGYEQLLNRNIKVALLFDPTNSDTIKSSIFDELIEYFEDIEDYEKCASLLHSKNLIYQLDIKSFPSFRKNESNELPDQALYDE